MLSSGGSPFSLYENVRLGRECTKMYQATFFTAQPLSSFWDNFLQDLAFEVAPYVLVIAATDVAVDIYTLLLPLPVIASLHMKRTQKWQIVGILWLGVL